MKTMSAGTSRYLLFLILIVVQFDNYDCWRSRPSPSRPRPSPTYRPHPRPSPTYRPFPRPSPTFRPFPHPSPTHRPFPTWSPTRAPTYRPSPTHATTFRPFPSHTTYKPFPSHTTYKPFPSHTTYRPFPSHTTYRPFPNYLTSKPNYGTTRYPTRYPTKYPTQPTRYPVAAPTRAPTHRTTGRNTTPRHSITRSPTFHTTKRHNTHRPASSSRTTRYPITTTPWFTTTRRHGTSSRRTSTQFTTKKTTTWATTTIRPTRFTTRRTTYLPFSTTPAIKYTTRRSTHLPKTTIVTNRLSTGRTTYRPITNFPTISYTTRRSTHLPITTTAMTRYTTRRSTHPYIPTITQTKYTTRRSTHLPVTTIPTIRYTTKRTTHWPVTTLPTITIRTTTRGPKNKPTYRWPTTYGPHPSYPGYQPGGVFTPSRHYQPTYSVPVRIPSPGGSRVKIYNVNNYHSPSYWAPPSYPVYSYTYRDTGNSALGFYLGYSLGRITHPTYYYHSHSFYDGYSPRYDHYTVHHYYHNNQNVPREQTINTKVIIQCGDGSQICPANTTSLCTANGQIMCVVIASNTIPCKDNANLQCVRSMVPCENNEAPECKGITKGQSAVINIPCISSTTIEGNVTTVNNTIISTDPVNKTEQAVARTSASQQLKTLLPNITTSSTTPQSTVPVTTLPTVATTLSNVTFPSLGSRKKRATPQYCVTILAQPTKRAPTEGEKVYAQITNIFDQFFSKAFGTVTP